MQAKQYGRVQCCRSIAAYRIETRAGSRLTRLLAQSAFQQANSLSSFIIHVWQPKSVCDRIQRS